MSKAASSETAACAVLLDLGVQTKYFVASYHGPVLDKVYLVQSANNYPPSG